MKNLEEKQAEMREYYAWEKEENARLRREINALQQKSRRVEQKLTKPPSTRANLQVMSPEDRKTYLQLQQKTKQKAYRQKTKELVFGHYGKWCYCCNETLEALLTLDHIRSDGWYFRKYAKIKNTWKWAVANGFPNTLRISCWNCNVGRNYNNGVCPHLGDNPGVSHWLIPPVKN